MERIQKIQTGAKMIPIFRRIRIVSVAVLATALGACTTTYETRELSHKETTLDRPASSIKDSELLSVRIETFNPGKLPEDPNMAKGLSPEIRNAESYYFPVQLKNAMQRSGHWGPVRVVPKGTREGEVIINGQILESDGEILKLEISVKDARGIKWFTKKYESVVDEDVYRRAEQKNIDVFQYPYNEIANDIAKYKKKLTAGDSSTIRQVSELRFGADFAPDVFNSYISKASTKETAADKNDALHQVISFLHGSQTEARPKPVYTIMRLPSKQDPIVRRVNRIRVREEFLIDTLDQQYDGLARNISDAYTQWRRSRLKEINAIRESDNLKNKQQGEAIAIGIIGALAGAAIASAGGQNCYSCGTAGAVAGTAIAIAVQKASQASSQAEADMELRKIALEELGQSLVTDVKPIVIEVEGQTVELKGTVEEKFQRWRKVLKELREKETGPVSAPSSVKSS
jgi:hypothetical protein